MHEILGIGGPILDLVLPVPHEYLDIIPGKKWGMEPIDFSTLENIILASGATPIASLGGSARNTIQGMVRLGEKCAFLGMIGKDKTAKTYQSLLENEGIISLLLESETPSAIVLSIVTPDGERTMRTFQGASIEFRGRHLDPIYFSKTKLVHIEGYALYNEDLVESACRMAQEAGAKISFDLSSFEVVNVFKDKILYFLEEYIDIVFSNDDECMALWGESGEIACDHLANLCEVGLVLMGEKGAWVRKGGHKAHCPAYPVKPVDTTGAGDLFASGFLHAYLKGLSLEECAHYGAIAGRAVVQIMGAQISEEGWKAIYRKLNTPL
ncbi:MAG: adenosine kinase [Chlamydiia bacterium]|nr:adenosine kinase [Chlamydiia bacterium]